MTHEDPETMRLSKKRLKEMFDNAKAEIEELGGREAFIKTGDWVLALIKKSFRNYFEKANIEYFRSKYSNGDNEYIASKLISLSAKNASLLGGITGAAITADEIIAIATGGEGGIGLPANIAIAVTALSAEAIVLIRIQLKLIAELAKLYEVPLDPEDPEDILIIFGYAVGGAAVEELGKLGVKIGGKLTERSIKKYISNEVLAAFKSIGRKIGMKILQRSIIKYAVPLASISIGAGWNFASTKSVGAIGKKHMLGRYKDFTVQTI